MLAIASASTAAHLDEDMPLFRAALDAAGLEHQLQWWDDPSVDWAAYDLVVIRAAWDYLGREEQFLGWAEQVSAATRLCNPMPLVRWTLDKHYLADLGRAGLPVTPTTFIEPGATRWEIPDAAEVVVKPCVSAGSNDTERHRAEDRAAIDAQVARLVGAGRSTMIQPYLTMVDTAGETALVYFDGRFSHAARKGPILNARKDQVGGLFAAEEITPRTPSPAERSVGDAVIEWLTTTLAVPVYARVDLLPSETGPTILEVELAEPSLFLQTDAGSAARFVAAVAAIGGTDQGR